MGPARGSSHDCSENVCLGKRQALRAARRDSDARHVHLVLAPLYDGDGFYCIAEITQGIKSSSAHKINRLPDREGQVWQRESFDRALRREEKIQEKVDYIIQNPVRAGLVNSASKYPWIWVAKSLGARA